MESILGLDIGSHTIKLLELKKDSHEIELIAAGSVRMPAKPAEGRTLDEEIATVIKQLLKDTGAKSTKVNISLPEAQVFTRVIEVPQLSAHELSSAIKWEAEQYIPLPLDQVNLDYTVLRDSSETKTDKMEVLLAAAPKVLVERYLNILELTGLESQYAETEIIAACRALLRTVADLRTVLIISLGAQTTDLAIIRGGVLAFTRSISAGGEALSRSLAQSLEFNFNQAEEYKLTYGLQKNRLEGKIVEAVKPIMDTIISEVKRAISFYQDKHAQEPVQSVILNGGTARLPGMVVYVTDSLGLETQLANPWVGIKREARFQILDDQGPSFAVALGLALR